MEQDLGRLPPSPAGEPATLPALSTAEDDAYWRGYHAALAAQAAPPDDPASPRVRRMRVDGFTGAKQVVFLEAIAEGLTVAEAAARAGVSVTTVYNFRNRRAGPRLQPRLGGRLPPRAAPARRSSPRPLAEGQTETVPRQGWRDRRHPPPPRQPPRHGDADPARPQGRGVQGGRAAGHLVAEEFEELLDASRRAATPRSSSSARRPSYDDYRGPRELEPGPTTGPS